MAKVPVTRRKAVLQARLQDLGARLQAIEAELALSTSTAASTEASA